MWGFQKYGGPVTTHQPPATRIGGVVRLSILNRRRRWLLAMTVIWQNDLDSSFPTFLYISNPRFYDMFDFRPRLPPISTNPEPYV